MKMINAMQDIEFKSLVVKSWQTNNRNVEIKEIKISVKRNLDKLFQIKLFQNAKTNKTKWN